MGTGLSGNNVANESPSIGHKGGDSGRFAEEATREHRPDVRVGHAAFEVVYGRHRPEEADDIRLFRLVKQAGSAWIIPADIEELVWAVTATHCGLDFLRQSSEFLRVRNRVDRSLCYGHLCTCITCALRVHCVYIVSLRGQCVRMCVIVCT